jgi:putative hydrolase of the HAD superfamily
MLKGERFEGKAIKGLIFDCYKTLIDIITDEESINTYEPISKWLIYQGVKITPDQLMWEYKRRVKEELESSLEKHPEVKVEEILSEICSKHALWRIDEAALGMETARTFRSASIRQLQAFPQSVMLLESLRDYPMAVVSNGQRVFSEPELKYLDLHRHFKAVIFSSDFGHKKPDPRLFMAAADQLRLQPEEILSIGDSFENDINPAMELGMKAMHIDEAWRFFKVL